MVESVADWMHRIDVDQAQVRLTRRISVPGRLQEVADFGLRDASRRISAKRD